MVNLQKNDQPAETAAEAASAGQAKKRLAFPEVIITVMIVVTTLAVSGKIVVDQYELAQHHRSQQQANTCQQAANRGDTLPEGCGK